MPMKANQICFVTTCAFSKNYIRWGLILQAGEGKRRAVRTLETNKTVLHKIFKKSEQGVETKRLGLSLGLTTWREHLCCEHYERRKPCKRVDVCDTCLEFDRKGVPLVKIAIATSRTELRALAPTYFDDFDAQWRERPNQELLTASFVEALERFIYNRADATKRSAPRSKLPPAVAHDLHDAEARAGHLLRERLDMLRCYEHHYQSVQRQHAKAMSILDSMTAGTLFLQVDFKQNVSLPLAPQEGGSGGTPGPATR